MSLRHLFRTSKTSLCKARFSSLSVTSKTGFAQVRPNDHVWVAMSSGVDSAACASLLAKQLGPEKVHGIFMTNWTGAKCADSDWRFVEDVSRQVGIDCHRVSFEQDYWLDVFEPMLAGYRAGVTPNPDVMCNQHIKFGALVSYLQRKDPSFKWLATGHYAGINNGNLVRAKDTNKDQSYYLATVPSQKLKHALFPLAETLKTETRAYANDEALASASKPDSQGLCFIEQSERSFSAFLSEYIEPNPGPIMTIDGVLAGEHQGLWTATIGQRVPVNLPQHKPEYHGKWFAVEKRPLSNTLVVGLGGKHPLLYATKFKVHGWQWRLPAEQRDNTNLKARYQSLGNPSAVTVSDEGSTAEITFAEPQRAVAPGQYIVVYDGEVVAGVGVAEQAIE